MGLSSPTGRGHCPLLFQTVSLHASLAHNIMKKQVLSVISCYDYYVFSRINGSFCTTVFAVLDVVWCRQQKEVFMIAPLMPFRRRHIVMFGIVKFCAGLVIGFGVGVYFLPFLVLKKALIKP